MHACGFCRAELRNRSKSRPHWVARFGPNLRIALVALDWVRFELDDVCHAGTICSRNKSTTRHINWFRFPVNRRRSFGLAGHSDRPPSIRSMIRERAATERYASTQLSFRRAGLINIETAPIIQREHARCGKLMRRSHFTSSIVAVTLRLRHRNFSRSIRAAMHRPHLVFAGTLRGVEIVSGDPGVR